LTFKHLLVPLDGSQLAEAVLPAVARLAKLSETRVTLLHVIEENAPREVHGYRHLVDPDEAGNYIEEVASRPILAGLNIERHVHTTEVDNVARSIVAHTEEIGADLVVMCTHGGGGLRHFILGSIAQQVLSLGKTPLLLITPQETGEAPAFGCQRILVPLDGNPDHEQGLAVAADLAANCAGVLHIVAVVYTLDSLPSDQISSAIFLPGATSAVLELNQQGVMVYLQNLVKRIGSENLDVTAEVQRGDPVKGILQSAKNAKSDLIVMATHGKSAMGGFWSGSLTPKLLNRKALPLLLVPVEEHPD